MTDQPTSPVYPATPARRPFFKSTLGRVTLVGGVLIALGAGVAVAQQGWRHGGGGMMGGGMMGGRGLDRFCAADVGWVSQRMADGLTARLNLTDAQKPALAELRASAVRVAGEAKKLCADRPDTSTVPGRLAAAERGLGVANQAMAELKPKVEAFYATLTDEQKKQFDQMGPHGGRRGGEGRGHRGWRHGDAGEDMRGQGFEGRGWRHRDGGGEMRGPGWRQGMMQDGEGAAAQRDWN